MTVALEQTAAGDPQGGMALGEAIGDWSALGGYELEGHWDASCRRIVRASFDEIADRPARTLSGGERKQLVLDVLFASDAEVLALDEPDNFLDVPAKLQLERRVRESRKTILMISHDRTVLERAVQTIVTLEGHGAWVHDGSYTTYPEARRQRQERLGDAVRRWQEEEKRLREQTRLWKERARYSPDLANRAAAMETALEAVRRLRPTARAGHRPVDHGPDPWRRLRADRARSPRAHDRRADRRPAAARRSVLGRDPFRGARRGDRAQRLG